jgi:voltage-gated potassium channel
MRRRIYEILTNPRPGDGFGRAISIALLLLIAANVIASIVETDAALAQSAQPFFYWFEWASVVIFTIEYALRLWSCTTDPRFKALIRGRVRMAFTPMAIIDLAAIAPFYFDLLLPGTLDLRFLRALRLLRFLRLLRSSRVAGAFATVTRVLQTRRIELAVSMAVVVVAMLISAGAIYIAERNEPGTPFTSIPHAMWWSIETITTIGYGDMIPTTPVGKVIGGVVGFVGICAVALPVGILSSGFIDELNRRRKESAASTALPSCPHCGARIEPSE